MAEPEDDPAFHSSAEEPRPRWLVIAGVVLLVLVLAIAAFSLGVYVAERDLLR